MWTLRAMLNRARVRCLLGLDHKADDHGGEERAITLLLIHVLELLTGGAMRIHALCLMLLAGRLLHVFGVSQVVEAFRFRVARMASTFLPLLGAAAGMLLRPVYPALARSPPAESWARFFGAFATVADA